MAIDPRALAELAGAVDREIANRNILSELADDRMWFSCEPCGHHWGRLRGSPEWWCVDCGAVGQVDESGFVAPYRCYSGMCELDARTALVGAMRCLFHAEAILG